MALGIRPQQHRLTWPLTPSQVEGLDTMLETLFRALRRLGGSTSSETTEPVGVAALGAANSSWASGDDGHGGYGSDVMGPPGPQGIPGRIGLQGPPGLDGDDAEANWPMAAPSSSAVASSGITDAIVAAHVSMRV